MTLIEKQSLTDMKTAIDWVLAGHERGREFIPLISERYSMRYDRTALMQEASDYIRALASGDTTPAIPEFFNVPKKNSTEMRRVPHMCLLDKIALSWGTIRSWRMLYDTIAWTQALPAAIDHHHSLPADPANIDWIENFLPCYRSFTHRTDAAHASGYWIVHLDVRNFANNASFARTVDILRERGAPGAAISVLESYAQAWKDVMPGVPMGLACTDALLKLFMSDADCALFDAFGSNYFRYVDDMRILCASEDDAKTAVRKAATILEAHGMELNPRKTLLQDPYMRTKRLTQQFILHDTARSVQIDVKGHWAEPLYTRWIEPRLKSGETEGEIFRTIYKKTLYEMGERKNRSLISKASELLDQYREGGKYLMVYLARSMAGPPARHTIMKALTTENAGDTHHYEAFRRAGSLRMTYGLNARGLLPFIDGSDRPDYQRLFLDDAKRTLSATPVVIKNVSVAL